SNFLSPSNRNPSNQACPALWLRTCRLAVTARPHPGWHGRLPQNVLDHYENPRNVGLAGQGSKRGSAPAGRGSRLRARRHEAVQIDGLTIMGALLTPKFKTFGCGSAIASEPSLATRASLWTKPPGSGTRKIAKELRLPPVKLHCSMLAEDAIKAALKDFKVKNADEAE
uniref:NifU_N domain-containing protein n=1 Tax=Macrostomum lignano TaxID=282301 RepID=A0A1I8F533_9PLAT